MKSKISYVCQECGYDSPKYLGRCPECGEWSSLREVKIADFQKGSQKTKRVNAIPKTLSQITSATNARTTSGFSELDGVLGGGIVPGSVTLLAGDPGIGKSTILLQLGLQMAMNNGSVGTRVLYVSGEESEEQVKLRAQRLLNGKKDATLDKNFLLLAQTDADAIVEIIEQAKPDLVIVDSIQTMESENVAGFSGSVAQVRYSTALFIKAAKTLNIPFMLVGHVTKEGMVAGPMLLSHMVDTVLFLEGEKNTNTRILRSFKNRFGPVDEVGIFAMQETGMNQVKDIERFFFTQAQKAVPGSVLVSVLEGTRAFLVEIQGLVVFSKLPIPRRVASGVDARRLELLLAVLQKHANIAFGTMDVFVNVAGGLKVSDRAADLGICLALFSSLKNVRLPETVAVAEVGLLGELRNVPMLEKRVKEATKLGFKHVISAQTAKTLSGVIKSLSK